MDGELTNEEFMNSYPLARIDTSIGIALVAYKNIVKRWFQHADKSWSRYTK
jgi:hypothetical protein